MPKNCPLVRENANLDILCYSWGASNHMLFRCNSCVILPHPRLICFTENQELWNFSILSSNGWHLFCLKSLKKPVAFDIDVISRCTDPWDSDFFFRVPGADRLSQKLVRSQGGFPAHHDNGAEASLTLGSQLPLQVPPTPAFSFPDFLVTYPWCRQISESLSLKSLSMLCCILLTYVLNKWTLAGYFSYG